MINNEEKRTGGKTEILSSDEQNVSRLLSNLKRVDAPKDFDFHLKARIAKAAPGDYRPVRLLPVLKYALPLALFLFVGAAIILTNSYSESNGPAVADVPSMPTSSSYVADINSGPSAAGAVAPPQAPQDIIVAENPRPALREFVVQPSTGSRSHRASRPSLRDIPSSAGSYDITGNSAPPAIPLVRSGTSNSNSIGNPVGTSGPIETRQVLRNLGIDANSGESGWMVRSVVKNSIAERSGLRAGDVMEAIDDKPISTLYESSFTAKTISARRDGKIVKIEIRNQ